MASTTFSGAENVTTAYAVDDVYTLNIAPASITNITQSGTDVVIQTGATSLTITGVSLAALATTNFVLQGGGSVTFGDGLVAATADAGTNTVTGSAFGDVLMGLGGADTITATNGDNLVVGGFNDADDITIVGNGDNTVYGGTGVTSTVDGDDQIEITGNGNNVVYGNAGDDNVVVSGTGANSVYGGLGNDEITLNGNGNSLVVGGVDDTDTIEINGDGNNTIYGGSAFAATNDLADRITVSGDGDNLIYGNGGNDQLFVFGSGNNSIYGGVGDDAIFVNSPFGSTDALGDNLIQGGTGNNDIFVSGTGGNTTIYGGNGETDAADLVTNVNLNVTGGTHSVYSNAGNDVINATVAGAGLVNIFAGTGDDTVTFGAGADTTGTAVIYGNDGSDRIDLTAFTGSSTIYGGNSIIDTADTADNITGGTGADLIYGNGGDDLIAGGAGNDSIYGGIGNDTINGGDGSDLIVGGAGQDLLTGGATTPATTAVAPVQEVQTVTVTGDSIDGESFTITTAGGDAVTYTSDGVETPDTIAAQLATLISSDSGNATASASNGVITVTYTAPGNVDPLTATTSNGQNTGSSVAVGQSTQGVAAADAVAAVGADTFSFGTNSDAGTTFANADLITDLNLGGNSAATAGDHIQLATGSVTVGNFAAATAAASLDAAIASLGANEAGLFTNGGNTYLVIDQGAANGTTFAAGEDFVINVTGVTGTLDASDFLSATSSSVS